MRYSYIYLNNIPVSFVTLLFFYMSSLHNLKGKVVPVLN
jgi:hypothetical protein